MVPLDLLDGPDLRVVDVHDAEVETVEEIKRNIRQGLKVVPPEKLTVSPDCGVKPLPRAVAYRKTENMVQAAREAEAELDPLTSFILPGGSEAGATLHHARAVARRAERRAVALAADEPVNGEAIRYLNRLSDGLFVFARLVNARDGVPEESPTY